MNFGHHLPCLAWTPTVLGDQGNRVLEPLCTSEAVAFQSIAAFLQLSVFSCIFKLGSCGNGMIKYIYF